MPSRLEFLLNALEADGSVRVGLAYLVAVPGAMGLSGRHLYHHGPVCDRVKGDPKLRARCLRHEILKRKRAEEGGETFVDACPFGVVDHVRPIGGRFPVALVYVHRPEGVAGKSGSGPGVQLPVETGTNAGAGFPIDFKQAAPLISSLVEDVVLRSLPTLIPEREQGMDRKMHWARALLGEGCTGEMSLSRLARAVGLDRSVLARNFRRVFGRTVHEELLHRRLAHACDLLRQGAGVLEAAHGSGFNHGSYFGKVFRAHFGCTPLAWKRRDSSRRDRSG